MKQYAIIEFQIANGNTLRDTASQLKPTLAKQEEIIGGWIRALNDKFDYKQIDIMKIGKWIIRFNKMDDKLDKTWEKVIAAVKSGKLWEAKVSVPSEQFPDQVILIYTKDYTDKSDVFNIHKLLESMDIITVDDSIEYKTEQATLTHTDASLYTSADARMDKGINLNLSLFKNSEKTPLINRENFDAQTSCCVIL